MNMIRLAYFRKLSTEEDNNDTNITHANNANRTLYLYKLMIQVLG